MHGRKNIKMNIKVFAFLTFVVQTLRPDLRLCRYLVRQTLSYLSATIPSSAFLNVCLILFFLFCRSPILFSVRKPTVLCFLLTNKCIYWFCRRSPPLK